MKKAIFYKQIFIVFSIILLMFSCYNKDKTNSQEKETTQSEKEQITDISQQSNPEIADAESNNTEAMDQPSSEAKKLTGVWTNNDSPIIEITSVNTKFKIRESYGDDTGTEYWGYDEEGKIYAEGNAKDFYKQELPSFELLANGKLKFSSGVGPVELSKTNKAMPNIKYNPPKNND